MGVIQFADMDIDAEMANDERVAEELDERMAHVQAVATDAKTSQPIDAKCDKSVGT